MKNKILSISIIAILMVVTLGVLTGVNAATPQEDLMTYLSKDFTLGKNTVALSDSEKVRVERIIENELDSLTAADVDAIKTELEEVIAYVEAAGVKEVSELSAAQQNEVVTMLNEATAIVGMSVTYDSADKTMELYKGSEMLDSIGLEKRLAQTGGFGVEVITIAVLAVVLVSVVAIKKFNK